MDWNLTATKQAVGPQIVQLISARCLPQVLLFHGPKGLELDRHARCIAALHLCHRSQACGSCPSCRELAIGQHADAMILSAAGGAIRVSDLATLEGFLSVSPQDRKASHPQRILVILALESLSLIASNKLLKLFEEVPPDALVVLFCSRLRSVPLTLRSRCVTWPLKVLPDAATKVFEPSPLGKQLRLLITAPDAGEVLKIAEQIQRQIKPQAFDLLEEFEGVLNTLYRDNYLMDPARLHSRRAFLKLMRSQAEAGINLNMQLVMEKLGLLSLR